jgi:hypothetical protein
MFTSFYKKQLFNKALSEFCFQSTMKSLQNFIERYQLERKMILNDYKQTFKYSNLMTLFKNPNENPNTDNKPYFILAFIPLIYIFYQRRRFIH